MALLCSLIVGSLFSIQSSIQTATQEKSFGKLGENVTLLCTLTKVSDAIVWKFKGKTYSSDFTVSSAYQQKVAITGNYNLNVYSIQAYDVGQYECSTYINSTLHSHIVIFKLSYTETTSFGRLSENVILECTLEREENPIEWSFNGITYANDYNVSQNKQNKIEIVEHYNIRLFDVVSDDLGQYVCSTISGGYILIHNTTFYVTNAETKVFGRINDTVTLVSKFRMERNLIQWRFDGYVYSSGNTINPFLTESTKNRLHIVGSYDLQISKIKNEDGGQYVCSTSINGTLLTDTVTLIIYEALPTSISIKNEINNKLFVTEGQSLLLSCTAIGGKPPPEIILTVSNDGVDVTGSQYVQYTVSNISRDFDRQICTCATSYKAHGYALSTNATLILNLRASPPVFIQTLLSTEETIPLSASCTSEGSRPPAYFQWYIGSNNLTNFARDRSTHNALSDTYTVNSTLTFSVDRSHDNKTLICCVYNVAVPNGVQTSKQLNVKYSPKVIVQNKTFSQNDETRTVICIPDGNPTTFTFGKWKHKLENWIQEIEGGETGILTLQNPVEMRYRETGEYICSVSNGIKDKDDDILQTGVGYVTVNAHPVFTNDNYDNFIQYGEVGKDASIHVNVYSMPKFNSSTWVRYEMPLEDINKFIITYEPRIINDDFHGTKVKLNGYTVTLTIKNTTDDDFTNYTLQLSNGYGPAVEHTVILDISKTQRSSVDVVIIVASVVGTLAVTCTIIIALLIIRKGRRQSETRDGNSKAVGFNEMQIKDKYEEVSNKYDVPHEQCTKTYESLGPTDARNVYDDIKTPDGTSSSTSSCKTYESLGPKDALNDYDDLQNPKVPVKCLKN